MSRDATTAVEDLDSLLRAAKNTPDRAQALRLTDRGYRLHPEERDRIYRPYAELLAADGHDDRAALAMLNRAAALGTDAALEATTVEVLLRLEDQAGAKARLESALARLALDPDGPLAAVARALVLQDTGGTPGFIGMTRDFALYGWAPLGACWRVRVAGEHWLDIHPDLDGSWQLALSPHAYGQVIEAYIGAVPVAGNAAVRPLSFGLSAQLDIKADSASVTTRCEWDPAFRPELRVAIGARTPRVRGKASASTASLRFELSRALGLDELPWYLSLCTPCGGWWSLPDSPLLWPRAAVRGLARSPHRAPRRPPRIAPCAVVVPVYEGRQETLACLESVLRTLPPGTRLIVVDDATPNPALARELDALHRRAVIELIRHAENRGFSAAINSALALCPGHDVVLLNADTLVGNHWLERLARAAYAQGSTGTVTPWSGDGSIVSYPRAPGREDQIDASSLDALVSVHLAGQTALLPVGVGFCLYIRHDCLTAVGVFAAGIFGRGYGEETDFCLRARAAGFRSVLAADVYVEHLGGRSFGPSRATLYARAQRLVELRHPGYAASVARYLKRDLLRDWRRQLDAIRLVNSSAPAVLLVSLSLGGGVGRYVENRSKALSASGHTVVVLEPDGLDERQRVRLTAPTLAIQDLVYDSVTEQAELLGLLRDAGFLFVELNHILNLPLRFIDALFELGIPVDVQIHDYAYLCPQLTLMGRQQRYCGEPALTECVRCVRAQGSLIGGGIGAASVRRRSGGWFSRARRVQVPSEDTAARYRRHFPDLDIVVTPHEPVVARTAIEIPRAARARTRVALLGAIGDHKGYRVLLECARLAATRNLPLEFIVVGYTQDDAKLMETGRVFITGQYADEELLPLLRREQPDVIFLASVWPETWSYTLDAALATDLPIVCFDIGATVQRLALCRRGNLLPLDTPAEAVCTALIATPSNHNGLEYHPHPLGVKMADAESNAISTTVQVLPLPAGVYLFSIDANAAKATTHSSGLSLPALHVGTGPGVAAADVEVMGRTGTSTGWLARSGDFLVLRLSAVQTPVLVTSLQDGAGNALSVRAERLDARFEDPAPEPLAAQSTRTEAIAGLPLHIAAHVCNRGTMSFVRTAWAGRVGKGLWIESFSIRPLEGIVSSDLEYKSLTSSGFETPWISDDKLCGTQGMGVPLIGFAVRLKPGTQPLAYDVEYSGVFASGTLVGPLKNGVPCRSTVANDPLEGLQVKIIRRNGNQATVKRSAAVAVPAALTGKAKPKAKAKAARGNSKVVRSSRPR